MPFTGDINLDFIFFAIQGDSDSVQALLYNGADVNAKENCGGTALMWAVAFCHIDTIGFTALTYAAILGKITILQTLLKESAYVNNKDDEGHTAVPLN